MTMAHRSRTSRSTWLLARPLLVLLAALLALSAVARVQAHAELGSAEPAPSAAVPVAPDRLRVVFTEPIEPRFSSVKVLDAEGRRRDLDDLQWDAAAPERVSLGLSALEEGVYTVSWQVLSAVDGHVTLGVFNFGVGTDVVPSPIAAPDLWADVSVPRSILQALVVAATLFLVGGTLFHVAVLGMLPALQTPVRAAAARRLLPTLRVAVIALILINLAFILFKTVEATGVPWTGVLGGPLADVLTGTRLGQVWTVRMALTVVLAALLFLPPAARGFETGAQSLASVLVLALGIGLIATVTAASHAAAGALPWIGVPVDFAHQAAAAAWIGGLVAFAVALRQEDPDAALAALVPRFSVMALVSFLVLGLTGLVTAWLRIGSPAALTGTPYGIALAAKLALVIGLAALAAFNLSYLRPRLQHGVVGVARLLERIVRVEVVLGALIIVVTGLLTTTPPAREAWARLPHPLRLEQTVDGLIVRLRVAPAGVGPNVYAVTLTDDRGRRVEGAAVEAEMTFRGADLGVQRVAFAEQGDGVYEAEGAELSLRGLWQALVTVRRTGAFDAQAAFRFSIPIGGAAESEPRLPRFAPTAGGSALIGLEVLVVGLIVLAISRRLRSFGTKAARVTGLVGIAVAFLGCGIAVSSQFVLPTSNGATMGNPFPPTGQSLATGRAVFQEKCIACHGTQGRGDGPQAADLNPPPLDLTVHVPLHPEGAIFTFIADGVPGTAMPAFRGALADEQIWHLVNYLQALAREGEMSVSLAGPSGTSLPAGLAAPSS